MYSIINCSSYNHNNKKSPYYKFSLNTERLSITFTLSILNAMVVGSFKGAG